MKRTLGLLFVALIIGVAVPSGSVAAQDCRGCVQNIDPDAMGSGGNCPTATDYESCMKRCECKYAENRKKCGTGLMCLEIATSERNACLGNCMTDYAAAPAMNPFQADQPLTFLAERLGISSPRLAS